MSVAAAESDSRAAAVRLEPDHPLVISDDHIQNEMITTRSAICNDEGCNLRQEARASRRRAIRPDQVRTRSISTIARMPKMKIGIQNGSALALSGCTLWLMNVDM